MNLQDTGIPLIDSPHSVDNQLPITVILGVLNEEKNIEEAIRSVTWATKVYVVDSHSTDRTCEISTELGAEVVQFDYDGGWPKKRNWALQNLPIETPWVLILDGDERVDNDLLQEIKQAIQHEDIAGYYMRWKFIFLGRWMKHCWAHGWMMRLFRHGKAEYEDLGLAGEGGWDAEVHENIVLKEGKASKLKSWLTHDSNEDLAYWIRKQNEFSTWNAARRIQQLKQPLPSFGSLFSSDPTVKRKFLKSVFIRLPGRSFAMFVWLYFFKLGFLDGKEGFYFCRLRAIHEFNISAKVFEARLASKE